MQYFTHHSNKIRKIRPSLPQIILVSLSMHWDIQFCIFDTQGLNSAVIPKIFRGWIHCTFFFQKAAPTFFVETDVMMICLQYGCLKLANVAVIPFSAEMYE